MKSKTIEEKVEYIALLHKQNLNGRESEDELFEAGILAGIEETIEEKDEFAIEFYNWCNSEEAEDLILDLILIGELDKKPTTNKLLEIFKQEKGYE